ncbi:hypothetical protein ZEAMMB73_Zm00001d023530 [Zea mays]|uniref:SAP domain-containing protein n=1 Tax=Zea mays TaxID=4577 RepID=A0A1D6ITX7_MAIZE|nr:hypothetical protein ZEAMMB73_Zm00001d023530 [Zea mays]
MDRVGLQAFCKRHGLSARGSNADLIARLDAALGRAAGAEEAAAGVAARKACVRQTGGDADETKKVTFVEVGGDVPVKLSRRNSLGAHVPVRRSRRNSLGADVLVRQSSRNSLCAEAQDCELRSQVTCSPVVAKTRGKSAQAGSVEVGAVVPLRRSRRNSLRAAESEEVEVAVFVDRKRKCKNQENDKGVVLSAQVGASSRVTRRSSLAVAAAVLPPLVEPKRGRGEAAGVQTSTQVEVPARITRSRSIAPVVMSPTVVENKRRKNGDAQTNVELPTVSDVPRNDAPVTRSLRNRVVQVNNSVVDANKPATKEPVRGLRRRSVVSELHEKEKDVEKQLIVKQPVRRSSRKSVLPDMLENNIQSGKSQDNEKEQKLKEPIRRSRRSVATVLLEEQNSGLHEEKLSKLTMRRSTRKSVALNGVEKTSMDHTEIVVQSETLKGRSSKRRRTIDPVEMMPVKEANDDMIIREATIDTHKATHEYNKSTSRIQESCQVNATREEFSSGPLLVTVTPTNEIYTVQSIHEVVPGSESGDNAKENLDKSKQPQEHHDIQAVDSHLSETRSGELDQSSCIAGLVPHNCVASDDKALISGDRVEQSPVSGEGRVGLEANAIESGEKNLTGIMSTALYTKSLQHDIDIVAEETAKGDLEKPSLCSLAQKCKHQCGLLEEIVLPSRNMGSLPNAEESPFGLESLFWQESIHESVEYGAPASATTHTENGFGESKGCHVKSALENTHVSEPFSHHDTEENISKIGGCMHTSQQDNGMMLSRIL